MIFDIYIICDIIQLWNIDVGSTVVSEALGQVVKYMLKKTVPGAYLGQIVTKKAHPKNAQKLTNMGQK